MAGELKLDLGNTERELTSGETANLRKQLGLELGVDISSRADILSSTATTAQGILADTATQPGDLGTAAAANLGPSPGQILTIADPSLNTYDYLIFNGTNGQIGWSVAEVRTNLGITNVDDTADGDKPVSNATAVAILASPTLIGNTIFVAKNGTNTRTGLDPHDIRKPFLTCAAALAAATSGDTIHVFAGDYSAEGALGGKDGVDWTIEQGAISPSFNVIGAFTFTIDGDIGGHFIIGNASANVTCKGDVRTSILCNAGTQIAGNAGTLIYCGGGTQTAGSAGTFIQCANGTQIAGNAGTYIQCNGGTQTINNANTSHNGTTLPPIYLTSSGSLTINNSRIESTESGAEVVQINANWAGTFIANNCAFVNTTASSKGISYGATSDRNIQLKNCTIITGAGGVSIDAPSAQTVYIQGVLNTTHALDADIDWFGMDPMIDPGFTF